MATLDEAFASARPSRRTLAPALSLGLAIIASSPLFAQSGGPIDYREIPGQQEYSGRMIVRPLSMADLQERGLTAAQAATERRRAQESLNEFRIAQYVHQTDETIIDVPAGSTENDIARELMGMGCFQYCEPDWIVFPLIVPDDPLIGNQWHHNANIMDSYNGWDLHTGNSSVAVGICDTGIRASHEDFQAHRLEGYNAVDQLWESNGGDISNIHPHGTMVTGCAAANGNNSVGIAGVGWDLSHRMLRVSNSTGGSASLSTLQHAARTSVENGDRVASVSYSGVDNGSNLSTATYIKSIGGLLVWAAGNDGRNLTYGDRDADDILVIGATDSGDNKASFSAYGIFVDLVAPGVSVYTCDDDSDSDYTSVSGTSFATPLTAGLCALISSADPSLTPDQIESALKQSCDDLGSNGVDNTYGYGRIDVNNAMILVVGGGPPTADFSGTPTSGTAPLNVAFSDQSSGAPTSWFWDFGDGNTSTAQNPSHTYTSSGLYTVSLTATNDDGSDTLTRTDYISVSDPLPPVADFVGSPTSGVAPLTVDFSDLSANDPTSWSWNFGDGNTSTSQNPSHVYTTPGVYTVSLTASNAQGSDVETKVDYITVNEGAIGEGFILSKNADFSTDDRNFSTSDTLYVLVWSDQIDFNSIRKATWTLKARRQGPLRFNLTNNFDGTYTASYDLSGLPPRGPNWNFSAKIEDGNRQRYNPSTDITVQ